MISEQVALLALSRVQATQLAVIHQLIEEVGSAKELIENAGHIRDILPDAGPRLGELLGDESLVELAEKEVSISEKRYEVGKGTILELNSSQVSLTNTRLSYNNTIYDYLVAKSDLNKVLGKE